MYIHTYVYMYTYVYIYTHEAQRSPYSTAPHSAVQQGQDSRNSSSGSMRDFLTGNVFLTWKTGPEFLEASAYAS